MIQNRVIAGEYTLKPVGEKTRGIASLRTPKTKRGKPLQVIFYIVTSVIEKLYLLFRNVIR